MTRYILTGTSGRLGSRILTYILHNNLISAEDLIVSATNPDHVPAVAKQYDVEVRHGDYTDRTSLESAFAGGDVLFLVSHTDPGVKRVEYHKNAIESARAAGVRTVIYTSMMFGGETGLDSVIGIQQGHVETVKYLTQCGVDYVVVREGLYAQIFGFYASFQHGWWEKGETIFKKGDTQPLEWVIPNDAAIAFVDIDDLAEGNALILANYTQYVNQTLRLTGPRTTSVSEIAKLVEEKTGRKVDLRLVGRDEAVKWHKQRQTVPPESFDWLENNWGGWWAGLANGEGEVVDELLGKVLGRPAKGFLEIADEMLTPR